MEIQELIKYVAILGVGIIAYFLRQVMKRIETLESGHRMQHDEIQELDHRLEIMGITKKDMTVFSGKEPK